MRNRILFSTLLMTMALTSPVYAVEKTTTTEAVETVAEDEEEIYNKLYNEIVSQKMVKMQSEDGTLYWISESSVKDMEKKGFTVYEGSLEPEKSFEKEETEEDTEKVKTIEIYDAITDEALQDIRDQLKTGKHRAYIHVKSDATNVVIPADILQSVNDLNGCLGISFMKEEGEEGTEEEDIDIGQKYIILIGRGEKGVTVTDSVDFTSSFNQADNGFTFTCNPTSAINDMYIGLISYMDTEPGTYSIYDGNGQEIGTGTATKEDDECSLWIELNTLASGTISRTGDLPEEETEAEVEEETEAEDTKTTDIEETVQQETASETEANNESVTAETNSVKPVVIIGVIAGVIAGIGLCLYKKRN